MATGKFDIYAFADWAALKKPTLVGILSAHFAKGKKALSFEYGKDWLKTDTQRLLDPDMEFSRGHSPRSTKKIKIE